MRRFAFLLLALRCAHLTAADPPAKPAVTLVDVAGETVPLKAANWTVGTRRLAWLADPKASTEDGKKGPLAVEFRETQSTTYQEGVLTLVPVSAVSAVKYDADKQTVALTVAGVEGELNGTTQYKGINQFGLDAEVEKGSAGVALVKYRGGVPKTGFRGATFADPKAWPFKPLDRVEWTVKLNDAKAKFPAVTAANLRPLYRFPDGTEKVLPYLPFQKSLKLPFADLTAFALQPQGKGQPLEVEVTTSDGKKQTLSPLTAIDEGGKKATLLGLLADWPGGFRLFPLHTVHELAKK